MANLRCSWIWDHLEGAPLGGSTPNVTYGLRAHGKEKKGENSRSIAYSLLSYPPRCVEPQLQLPATADATILVAPAQTMDQIEPFLP